MGTITEEDQTINIPQPQGLGHPSYNGIPQHRYVCTLCSNKGHYDHQCHYAQQIMTHATAASFKAQQQEDYDYQHGIQSAYAKSQTRGL